MSMKKTTVVLSVFAALFVLTSCGQKENIAETTAVSGSVTESVVSILSETEPAAVPSTEQETYPFYQTDENTFLIETKYCNLFYPSKWQDRVRVDISDSEIYTVTFYGLSEYGEERLFDFLFGTSEEGFRLGTLTVNGESTDIYVISYEFDESDLPNDVYNDLCSMEEDINVVISKLIENYDFKLS